MNNELTQYDLIPIIGPQVRYHVNHQILKTALDGKYTVTFNINDFIDDSLCELFKSHIHHVIYKVFEGYNIKIKDKEIFISWENIEPATDYYFYKLPNDLAPSEASMISYVQTDEICLQLKTKVYHEILNYINLIRDNKNKLHLTPIIDCKLIYYIIEDLIDDKKFKDAFYQSRFNGYIDEMKYALRLILFAELSEYCKSNNIKVSDLEPNTLYLRLFI